MEARAERERPEASPRSRNECHRRVDEHKHAAKDMCISSKYFKCRQPDVLETRSLCTTESDTKHAQVDAPPNPRALARPPSFSTMMKYDIINCKLQASTVRALSHSCFRGSLLMYHVSCRLSHTIRSHTRRCFSVITSKQKASFARDGFVVVENVCACACVCARVCLMRYK